MKKIVLLLLLTAVCTAFAGKITFVTDVNKKDAVYKIGDEIVFTAKLLEDKQPAASKKLGYRLMYDRKVLKCGLVEGTETITLKVKADKPGWVYLCLFSFGDNEVDRLHVKRVTNPKLYVRATKQGGIGAMVEPEKLRHSKEEPADFDEFWNQVKKELAKVPVKLLESKEVPLSVIKKAKIKNPQNYVFADIKVSCAGGMPVSGYLTMPKNAAKGSLPAIVTFHGAGVRSARLHDSEISLNMLVFDVNAHGIENSHPDAYYAKLNKEKYTDKKLGTYPQFGRDNRDTFYFKGMYMRVMRALEYIKTRPEWNGKVLVVSGGSQGGAQVLAACALDKDVTLAKCKVPALSDHFAAESGRCPGWPRILDRQMKAEERKAVQTCLSYYDGVYFAKRVKCPIYLYTGFIDTTCPPNGIFAVYNNLPESTFKNIYHVPTAGHSVPENSLFGKALVEHIEKEK